VKNCRRLTAAAALLAVLAVLAVSQTLAVDVAVAVADGLDVVVHIASSTVTADRPAHAE
jgi:hypothetical protein